MRRQLLLLAAVLLALFAAMAGKSLLVEPPALRAHSAAGEFDARRAKAREWFGLDDERHEKRGEGRRGHNPKLRTLRHRLKLALVDIMEGPAEKQDEAIAILEGSIEALEALARR